VELAFLRHATSKLRDEKELSSIGTLGFRGEALAAIASVSKVELLTCEKDAKLGTRLTMDGGKKTSKESVGCPAGTTMIIRDLFYNTPARFKFMKNDRAEGSNVTVVVTRLALSHPEVSIRYIREGKEEIHTPGDGRIDSCVYSTLGRDFAKSLLKTHTQQDGITVDGYISTPTGCRGNRSWQFFFLNGRFIKSKLLQAALEQGYKNSLFTGRFPVCVLDIKMNFSSVDVNVHPTKMEVRFSNEKQVFDVVYWAVRGALEKEDHTAELQISKSTASVIMNTEPEKEKTTEEPEKPKTAFTPKSPAGFSYTSTHTNTYTNTNSGGTFEAKPRENFYTKLDADSYRQKYSAGNGGFKTSIPAGGQERTSSPVHDSAKAVYQTKLTMPETKPTWKVDEPIVEAPEEKPWRYVGEVLTTYLVVEKGDSVFLIDKHAAHERVLFDKLKAGLPKSESQILLAPMVCRVGDDAAETILQNSELLSEFGIEVDDFGGGSVALRQVPVDIEIDDPTAFMEEIAEKLTSGGRQEIESMRDDVMHTVACKAAIKAGSGSERDSVMELIDKVMNGEVRYCPHGRPVSMELTKSQLDRSFKRA
jgi:DNA mismatch repair protein MutL